MLGECECEGDEYECEGGMMVVYRYQSRHLLDVAEDGEEGSVASYPRSLAIEWLNPPRDRTQVEPL